MILWAELLISAPELLSSSQRVSDDRSAVLRELDEDDLLLPVLTVRPVFALMWLWCNGSSLAASSSGALRRDPASARQKT
jgi:hypothetical protein